MKRILHCLNALDNGGVEAFIMNIYRNIDRDKIQFDFLIRSEKRTHYWDEIKKMGGKIYTTPSFPRHFISNYISTKKFLLEHREYDTIHVHANSLMYMCVLKLAKKLGIKNIIIHSHSTSAKNRKFNFIHNFNKRKIEEYANIFLACSRSAGEWMFNNDFKIIHNGIDSEKFRFSNKTRNIIREELGVKDELLIGNIGRFTYAKNHKFILEIFNSFNKLYQNSKLLLVGFGELENDIRNQIKKLNLENKVIILTDRNDAYNLLNAMDVFLFPSHFEGLPISLIEAQSTGVNCVVSNIDSIIEAVFNKNVNFLSLNSSTEIWCNSIEEISHCSFDRENGIESIKQNGYDISNTIEQLIKIYLG